MRTNLPYPFLAAVLFVLSLVSWSKDASAYPWMNRRDYNNCTACHTDPSGGGILTEYGRAQSAILLSTQFSKRGEDEEPGKFKDFLFGVVKLPPQVLLGAWVRNGYMARQNSPASGESTWSDPKFLQMRADVAAQVKLGMFRASGSIGYQSGEAAPTASSAWITSMKPSGDDPAHWQLVSREHWAGVDLLDESVLVRVGRMNMPFGLRNPEHNSWVRSATRTDYNVHQQHGVAVSYNSDKLRGEVMAIAGNLQLNPDIFRERGYSAFAEWNASAIAQVGVSSLLAHAGRDELNSTRQAPVTRQAHGLFGRVAPVKQIAFLAEADFLVRSTRGPGTDTGFVGFLQADYEPIQGLHVIATGETLKDAAPGEETKTRFGQWLGVWWFFLPHFDVRGDVIRRTPGDGSASMTYLLQLHAYL